MPLLPAEDVWAIELPAPPAAAGALDDRRVYVPLASGEVVALDRETGGQVWRQALESIVAPAAGAALVYVATRDGVAALDAPTGAVRWQVVLDAVPGTPLPAGDLLIVPLDTGVVALCAASGAARWSRPLEAAATDLAADDERIFVASDDGRLRALAMADGRPLWAQGVDGRLGPPAVARDRVFVGTTGNVFAAFHPRSGRRQWRWTFGGDVAGAAAGDDRVYVVSLDNLVRALNRGNGHQRWRQALATRPVAPPRLVGEDVVVAGVDPALSTFAAATGAPVATYAAPAELQGPPLIDAVAAPGGVAIVVVLRDGRVFGLRSMGAAASP